MDFSHVWKVLILAIVQGAAELLPVSSSAHVAVVSRLIGYDKASSPFEWAFLIVMLHTGTMFSVLFYFWARWKPLFKYLPMLLAATVATGALGYGLKLLIERYLLDYEHHQKIESLFQNFPLIAAALFVVGIIIIAAGTKEARSPGKIESLSWAHALIVGVVQGICLPFRGFSRSGATISTGMFLGIARMRAEEFSFALAVLLTPAVIVYEAREMVKVHQEISAATDGACESIVSDVGHLFVPGLLGMVFSFLAGLFALRLLSAWMERGHWRWFGYYCLAAAAVVLVLHFVLPAVV